MRNILLTRRRQPVLRNSKSGVEGYVGLRKKLLAALICCVGTLSVQGSWFNSAGNGFQSMRASLQGLQRTNPKVATGLIVGASTLAGYAIRLLADKCVHYCTHKTPARPAISVEARVSWNEESKQRFARLQSVVVEVPAKQRLDVASLMQESIKLKEDEEKKGEDDDNGVSVDLFTHYSFKELIEEQIERDKPYIIARVVTHDAQGNPYPHYYDAHSFNMKIFKQYPIEYSPQYLGQDKTDLPYERNVRDHYVYDPSSVAKTREQRRIVNMGNSFALEFDFIDYFIIDAAHPNCFKHLVSFKDLLQGSQAKKYQDQFMHNSDNGVVLCHTLSHDDAVMSAAVTPDGKSVITGSADKTVKIWDFESGQLQESLQFNAPITRVKITPDGTHLVVASGNELHIWKFPSLELEYTMQHNDLVRDVVVSNTYCVTAPREKRVGKYNFDTKLGIMLFDLDDESGVCSIALGGDGHDALIFSGMSNKKLCIYEPNNQIRAFDPFVNDAVHIIKNLSAGLIVVCAGGEIKVLRVGLEQLTIESVIDHNRPVYAVDVCADGKHIITASGTTAQMYNVEKETEEQKAQREAGQNVQRQEAIDRLREILVQNGQERMQELVDRIAQQALANGPELIAQQEAELLQNAFAEGAALEQRLLWQFQNAQLQQRLKYTVSHKDTIYCVKVTPDQKYFITGSKDKTAKVWDLQYGQLKYVLPHDDEIIDIVVSDDSKYIVTCSADKSAKIWKL